MKRIVTGAHYGLRDWLAQRVTAVVMAAFVLLLAAMLMISPPHDYASWKALFSNRWMRIASFLFSEYAGSRIGIRNYLGLCFRYGVVDTSIMVYFQLIIIGL